MLFNLSTIRGHAVTASDGAIGTVSDLLFDDASWTIRWLVVDTGNWLTGRKVLLPPAALGHPDPEAKSFPVRLTRAAVEASPELETQLPVSRQFETSIYDHYGWSPYWGAGYYMGGYGMLAGSYPMWSDPEEQRRAEDFARQAERADAPQLRSAEAVTGYHLQATDGSIGHLADLLVDDTDWSVHYLVVDTSNWWNGKLVLISPRAAKDIRWTEQLIYLDVDRATVKASPPYDPAKPVDRSDEQRMAEHYATPPQKNRPTAALAAKPVPGAAAEPQEAG